jgi:hypothetical protein
VLVSFLDGGKQPNIARQAADEPLTTHIRAPSLMVRREVNKRQLTRRQSPRQKKGQRSHKIDPNCEFFDSPT